MTTIEKLLADRQNNDECDSDLTIKAFAYAYALGAYRLTLDDLNKMIDSEEDKLIAMRELAAIVSGEED